MKVVLANRKKWYWSIAISRNWKTKQKMETSVYSDKSKDDTDAQPIQIRFFVLQRNYFHTISVCLTLASFSQCFKKPKQNGGKARTKKALNNITVPASK